MIKFNVPNTDHLKREIAKQLEQMVSNKFVTVGIHEDTGNHPGTDMTNAQLGALQHFGNDNIPPRPWLDVGVETGNKEYLTIIKDAIKNETPMDQALERVGVVAVGKAQVYMTQLKSPANAESTIKAKGSSNPLIDTGELRASVNYKIQPGKPKEGIE